MILLNHLEEAATEFLNPDGALAISARYRCSEESRITIAMNGKGFQALVAQLGELSVVQREALMAALKGRLSLDEAIGLIDRRFKAEPCCGHCGSKSAGGWSSHPIASPRRVVRIRQSACRRSQPAQSRRASSVPVSALKVFEQSRQRYRAKPFSLDTSFRWASSFSQLRKRRESQIVVEGHCRG